MDCYNTQRRSDCTHGQPAPMPCSPQARGMAPSMNTIPEPNKVMGMPPMPPRFISPMTPPMMNMNQRYCPGSTLDCFDQQYVIGMAYVPWQCWGQTYNLPQALQNGTIFPDLDKPFSMGRCR